MKRDNAVGRRGRKAVSIVAAVAMLLFGVARAAYAPDPTVNDAEGSVPAQFAEIYPEAEFHLIAEDVYEVRRGGERVGHVGVGSGRGYIGPIVLAVGVNLDGSVHRVRVISHSESTGWGDVIAERRFLDQFENLPPEAIRMSWERGQIDAITDATGSCRFATNIVRSTMQKIRRSL